MATSPPPTSERARRWATTQEAAEYLGVSVRNVRKMISDGRIRAYRSGGRAFRLDLNELDESMGVVRGFRTLNEAMVARDELAEAEIRYRLLAEAFEGMPQLRAQLNAQLERAKAEIGRLRALAPKADAVKSGDDSGKVVAFDAERFRKSG